MKLFSSKNLVRSIALAVLISCATPSIQADWRSSVGQFLTGAGQKLGALWKKMPLKRFIPKSRWGKILAGTCLGVGAAIVAGLAIRKSRYKRLNPFGYDIGLKGIPENRTDKQLTLLVAHGLGSCGDNWRTEDKFQLFPVAGPFRFRSGRAESGVLDWHTVTLDFPDAHPEDEYGQRAAEPLARNLQNAGGDLDAMVTLYALLQCDGPVVLFGHSRGGCAIMRMLHMLEHPEQHTATWEKLCRKLEIDPEEKGNIAAHTKARIVKVFLANPLLGLSNTIIGYIRQFFGVPQTLERKESERGFFGSVPEISAAASIPVSRPIAEAFATNFIWPLARQRTGGQPIDFLGELLGNARYEMEIWTARNDRLVTNECDGKVVQLAHDHDNLEFHRERLASHGNTEDACNAASSFMRQYALQNAASLHEYANWTE